MHFVYLSASNLGLTDGCNNFALLSNNTAAI